jgi:SPP1 family predicted phage head-tail adaptor
VKPRIGKLRHRLTLEAPYRTADDGGGAVMTWAAIADIWGSIEAASGSERLAADRLTGTTQPMVTIRYRADVTTAMRFLSGDRTLLIRAVLDTDGTRRFLRCLCEERDL